MLIVARIVCFVFAALLIVGGILGYVEKRSVISLVAGLVCGALSLAAGVQMLAQPRLALVLAIAAAVLTGGGMAPRYAKSRALFPAGITLAASLLTLGVSVAALLGLAKSGGTIRAVGTGTTAAGDAAAPRP